MIDIPLESSLQLTYPPPGVICVITDRDTRPFHTYRQLTVDSLPHPAETHTDMGSFLLPPPKHSVDHIDSPPLPTYTHNMNSRRAPDVLRCVPPCSSPLGWSGCSEPGWRAAAHCEPHLHCSRSPQMSETHRKQTCYRLFSIIRVMLIS